MTQPTVAPWAPPRHVARPPGLGHVPGLDGIRGIALIGVLLFHAGHASGAFLSLDLFFVLSGFLITSILLQEWGRAGRLDLKRFWSRRARRLLPAILVVVTATCAYAAIELDPEALHRFRFDALAALADVANWREIASGTDYWRAYEAPSPLRHTWSLSLEEQLYVAWPLVVAVGLAVGHRLGRGRGPITAAAVALIAASVLAMGALSDTGDTTRSYYGTDTRASAVLLGGLAALLLSVRSDRVARVGRRLVGTLALPAAVALGIGWVIADGQAHWTYQWGMPLGSVLASIVIAAVGLGRAGSLQPIVDLPPLQVLGRISYGVYLWHWPLYLVLDEDLGLGRWSLTGLRLGASIVLGTASYHLVEAPIREGRVGTRAWRVLGIGGFAVAVGAVLLVTKDAERPVTGEAGVISGGLVDPSGTEPRVLLLGDSQAFRLGEVGDEHVGPGVQLGQFMLLGCGTGPGVPVVDGVVIDADLTGRRCEDAVELFRDAIDQTNPDLVILNTGAWEVLDRMVEGRTIAFGTPAWDESTEAGLRDTLTRLADGRHRTVVLASPCYAPRGQDGGPVERGDDRRVERWNEILRTVAPPLGVEVLPLDDLFCGTDDPPDRPDGVHLVPDGAGEVWAWLLPQLDLDALVPARSGSASP